MNAIRGSCAICRQGTLAASTKDGWVGLTREKVATMKLDIFHTRKARLYWERSFHRKHNIPVNKPVSLNFLTMRVGSPSRE